jgi:hypothetical protein
MEAVDLISGKDRTELQHNRKGRGHILNNKY